MDNTEMHNDIIQKEIMDAISCGVFSYSLLDRKLITINATAKHMIGCGETDNPANALKSFFTEKIVAQDRERVAEAHKLLNNSGDIVSQDYTAVVNSNTIYFHSDIKCLNSTQGNPYILVTMIDITEQAEANFLAKISHDIRTPMNAIVGMIAIAQTNLDDKERLTDCLSKISISTKYLLGIINEVFDMSNLESGEDESETGLSLDALKNEDFSGKRALLVEDNLINAEIASEILGMAGLKIEYATNGKDAVDIMTDIEDGYFDVIFMDIQMPILNGYDATRAIRSLPSDYAKSVPIFAMTANAFADDVADAKNAGMNDHIAKPLDLDRLIKVMKQWL